MLKKTIVSYQTDILFIKKNYIIWILFFIHIHFFIHEKIQLWFLFFIEQWGAETIPIAPAPIQPGYTAAEDWSATDTGDWSATPAPAPAPANEWGGGSADNWE